MLKTEMRNAKTTHIDRMDTLDILKVMNEENFLAMLAVERVLPDIARAVEAINQTFSKNGLLFYQRGSTVTVSSE